MPTLRLSRRRGRCLVGAARHRAPSGAGGSSRLATAMVGAELVYVVTPGDSLTLIGAKLGADPDVIARANGLTANRAIAPWRPSPGGQPASRPARRWRAHRLERPAAHALLPRRACPVRTAGRGRSAGLADASRAVHRRADGGRSHVERAGLDPGGDAAEGQRVVTRVAPGPSNPLGTRYIGLSLKNIGIHGTNAPASVYRHGTHGCIRMQRADIEELYEQVRVGMTGRVIYEPVRRVPALA
jgi:L,D-transpeptidase ErfK/SrfK